MMSKNWLAVACVEHVRLGKYIGVMQVCHGKLAPLKRIKPNDVIIYYSPTTSFQGKDTLRSFTAIGIVSPGEPYQVTTNPDFRPFRRHVHWAKALEIPIAPLLNYLDFTRNNKNWGYQLRYGLIQMSEHDKLIIASAMQTQWL
ncbi:EVE domain-containing protein [Legionella sp. PC1000]|uniref:EVE domain-containing protein n=1 Tax=Legionella sp. PC1000 TaxID=2746060 RepID=UPI0018619DC1|nr:EVE domain-containing protein [Legionella sp. PC1000]QLZ69080.1 EVE domain-containing protein [Legionella sp. PC1000]